MIVVAAVIELWQRNIMPVSQMICQHSCSTEFLGYRTSNCSI